MSALSTILHELLADNVADGGTRIAIIDGDDTISYAALSVRVERLAAQLVARGAARGDRVIVHLRKSVDEVAAMFAVARIGAVVVNVSTQWTLDQLAYVSRDCAARLIVTEQSIAALARRSSSGLGDMIVAVDGPARAGDAAGLEQAVVAAACLDSDLAMILYTSGSTGMPKGVMLSHRNILAGARATARYLGLGADDRLLSVLPYSFDYGLNQLTSMMLVGGTVVHQAVPMASELVRTMQRHGVTGAAAVPPLWAQVVRLLERMPTPLPALRRITNSGGAIPRTILERMPHVFPGVDIYLMYGLTEAFRSTYLPPERFARKMGAIGQAIPGAELHVIRRGGGLAGPGEQGELVHRGPLVSMGYWGQPAATREKIRPCPELSDRIGDEPVVYSGDIVRIDEDGDLWFVARNDAMIKTSGFRVSPEEIEELVSRSNLVGDVVAFGSADDELGQVVHAAVAPLTGFTEAALLAHCRRVMPHYMVPRAIHVWHEPMPRTASGKLARPDVIRTSSAPSASFLPSTPLEA